MDFFEKAHVSKNQQSKKDSKSDEMVKKQLKQMLQGYKRSDNDLIKSSGNAGNDIVEAHRCIDDSASVSGFSDLDLTHSGSDEDISQPTTSKVVGEISSSSEVNVSNSTDLNSEDIVGQESMDEIDGLNLEDSNVQSLSEYKEDIESSSEDIEFSEDSCSSLDPVQSDLEETSTDLDFVHTDSDDFDADGALAKKILEKLGKSNSSQKSKKRKLEEVSKQSKSKKKHVKNKKNNKEQSKDDTVLKMEALQIKNEEAVIIKSESESNSANDSESIIETSPYVSITATEMPEQSLSDIIGDYHHPTIRNIQNVNNSTNLSGLFSIGKPKNDTDSLLPEIDDAEMIEELIDLEESTEIPDPSTEMPDESTEMPDESTEMPDDSTEMPDESTEMPEEVSSPSTQEEYINPIRVYHGKKSCIFALKHPIELYVNGKVKIKPIVGTVEVFGHILKDAVDLYAPNNHFAQCLKTIEHNNGHPRLFRKLISEGLTVSEAEDIVSSLGSNDSVITLSQLNDIKIDFVENNVYTDLFKKSSKNTESTLRHTSGILGCSLYLVRPWRYFEKNELWDKAISCGFEPNSRGIICGGKGLGKSTFLRYYVNKMLVNGPVLVIDLDPGQAEFTVAGNVSATVVTTPLLGPNYTHLKTPDIMFNIGMINTMDNATRYSTAVTDIFAHCRSTQAYSSMPWIINTMGMCTQMGLKFLLLTILHAQPTFLLQLDSTVAKKRFECHLHSNSVKDLYEDFKYDKFFRNIELPDLDYTFILAKHAEGSDKHNTSMSPKDDRYLNFLAYFGEILNIHSGVEFLGIVPYEVSLSDLIVLPNVKVSSDAILEVINGKIVALCQLGIGDKGKVFTLQDNAPLCLGHGLVRGVDFEKSLVYIVTPLAAAKLCAVDALVYADWTPELRGPERHLPHGTPVPYRSATHYGQKQLILSPRRRFNPLQLLKMSRSA